MRLIAACEDTGALKVINAQHGTDTSKPTDETNPNENPASTSTHATENSRKSKVVHLVKSEESGNILVARLNGAIELYDTSRLGETRKEGEETDLLPLAKQHKNVIPERTSNSSEIFVGLSIDDLNRVVAVSDRGRVFLWKSEEKLEEKPVEFQLPLNANEVIEAFQVHPGAENANYVAYGGKESDLRVVKLPEVKSSKGKPEVVFRAKNMSNTKLDLRVPVHIKNILFDKTSTPEVLKIYTFTAWGDLRYYDSSVGRKPRSSVLILPKKAPITKSIWLNDKLIVCDNSGMVVKVDPATGAQICQFKGHIGSTQSLYNFKDSILGTAGSDRYVRAYNNETRECIVKVFIGSQCNALVIVSDDETLRRNKSSIIGDKALNHIRRKEEKEEKVEQQIESDDDDDELWSKLESNITQRRKRRKLTLA